MVNMTANRWSLLCVLAVVGFTKHISHASVTIENNGYRNLVIAISDDVTEDTTLPTRLTEIFTAASQVLYSATRYARVIIYINDAS